MAVQELLSIVNGRPEDIPSFAVVPCLAFRRLPNAHVGLHDALKDRHAVAMLAGQRPLPPTSSCDREYSCSLLGPIPAAGSRRRTTGLRTAAGVSVAVVETSAGPPEKGPESP